MKRNEKHIKIYDFYSSGFGSGGYLLDYVNLWREDIEKHIVNFDIVVNSACLGNCRYKGR